MNIRMTSFRSLNKHLAQLTAAVTRLAEAYEWELNLKHGGYYPKDSVSQEDSAVEIDYTNEEEDLIRELSEVAGGGEE